MKPSIPTQSIMSNQRSNSSSSSHDDGQITAYLGPDTHIEGTLRFEHSVLIEGTFDGEIKSGGNLVVGENAEVNARIETRTITIKGQVTGTVEASERVQLLGTGKLLGDVTTPSIQMDETVTFEGSCSMPGNSRKSSPGKPDSVEKKKGSVDTIVDVVSSSST